MYMSEQKCTWMYSLGVPALLFSLFLLTFKMDVSKKEPFIYRFQLSLKELGLVVKT